MAEAPTYVYTIPNFSHVVPAFLALGLLFSLWVKIDYNRSINLAITGLDEANAHSQRLDALEESMNDIRMTLDEIKGRTNTVKQRLDVMNIGGPM